MRPSKKLSGLGTFKLIALALVLSMLPRLTALITALAPVAVVSATASAQAPTAIPSRVVKVVEFDDRGRTYRVELETGLVTFTDGGNVIPPAPKPPEPEPTPAPELTGLALRVNQLFIEKIGNRPEIANQLIFAIDVTLAKAGGLGLKGQDILIDLRATIDGMKLTPKLAGFPLGDALKIAAGDDSTKIISALKEAKAGLEAVR